MSLSAKSCDILLTALSHFDFKVTDDGQAEEFIQWRKAVEEVREVKERLLTKDAEGNEE